MTGTAGSSRRMGGAIGRVLVVAALVAGSLAGCESAPAPTRVILAVGDPSGPWQPQPFRVADSVLASAVASCLEVGIPAGLRPVLGDTRGLERMTLLFESADRKTSASCVTFHSGDGTWLAGASSVTSGTAAPPAPAPDEVQFDGPEVEDGGTLNGLSGPGHSTASGRIGVNVAGVQLIVAGRPITATVGGGWFSAWWPTTDPVTQITGIGIDGFPLPQRPAVR